MARGNIEKRGSRRRKIMPVILIVTEGSWTEPKYFEHFRTRQINISIWIAGSGSKADTDYISLLRKAMEYRNKDQLSVSNGDAIWVLADGDVNYNSPDPVAAKDKQLKAARKIAEKKSNSGRRHSCGFYNR